MPSVHKKISSFRIVLTSRPNAWRDEIALFRARAEALRLDMENLREQLRSGDSSSAGFTENP